MKQYDFACTIYVRKVQQWEFIFLLLYFLTFLFLLSHWNIFKYVCCGAEVGSVPKISSGKRRNIKRSKTELRGAAEKSNIVLLCFAEHAIHATSVDRMRPFWVCHNGGRDVSWENIPHCRPCFSSVWLSTLFTLWVSAERTTGCQLRTHSSVWTLFFFVWMSTRFRTLVWNQIFSSVWLSVQTEERTSV